MQNTNIKNRFKNLPKGVIAGQTSPINSIMYKTQNNFASTRPMLANAAIAELTASSKENSSRAPVGTPNTFKVSSVHERRCKAEENDELIMESREGGRPRIVASRDSKASEIRSRISGKQTADSKKEREKLGPGDDKLIRMRVFNSYKQIKFSGVGIGGKPAVFTKPGDMHTASNDNQG